MSERNVNWMTGIRLGSFSQPNIDWGTISETSHTASSNSNIDTQNPYVPPGPPANPFSPLSSDYVARQTNYQFFEPNDSRHKIHEFTGYDKETPRVLMAAALKTTEISLINTSTSLPTPR